jgi:hypothetical protein
LIAGGAMLAAQLPRNDKNRFPFSGTIDEIGDDIQRLKTMGVEHIIFNYNFLPLGRDMTKMIQVTKQLSKFAS